MEIVIILIISAAAALYIVLPFFLKSGSRGNDPEVKSNFKTEDTTAERLKALDNKKETLYSAIRDIDFDYGLGKLSKEDFEDLNKKYKLEAASVLKKIDEIQKQDGAADPDYDLEREIRSYRKTGIDRPVDDKSIEEEISAFRSASNETSKENKCSGCGSEYSSGDLFCSKCGARLN